MFHPSVYDNLKVVLEGVVYDSDFSGEIEIIDRKDIVDFAVIEKSISLSFIVLGISDSINGKIILSTNLEKLATEKLQDIPENAGCNLSIQIETPVYEIETDCKQLQLILRKWTTGEIKGKIEQKLTYIYGESRNVFNNTVSIEIEKPVTEDDTDRFSAVLGHVIASIKEFNQYFKGYKK
ncbi:hypothetical protein [Bacillus sp. NEB1478]|uniref:hypothetical protein n=1 Tax=Bacillus sp. NEB1478 TaxID=3073816 RepID=UPI002873A50E|nr:hypothetical protein [Bacillus sp. NEB1478]WNB93771.1 hypothetical protein RGB74_08915 [Bacillus sp. NEB1478]